MWSNTGTAALLLALAALPAHAQAPLQSATIVEHLGARVPASLAFTDDGGRRVALGSFLGGKPLVISLAYFTCPMLCHLGQDGAADAFRESGWQLGRDFRAVTVSIDPHDTPAVAHQWRARAAEHLHARVASVDWQFLVGDERTIRALANAVGFEYAYDAASGQYSHAAALFIVGADGRLSRYVYGITFEPSDIARALASARDSQTIASTETFLLRCFHYIPSMRRHGGFVVWMLRAGGLMVTLAIALTLLVLWRREVRA